MVHLKHVNRHLIYYHKNGHKLKSSNVTYTSYRHWNNIMCLLGFYSFSSENLYEVSNCSTAISNNRLDSSSTIVNFLNKTSEKHNSALYVTSGCLIAQLFSLVRFWEKVGRCLLSCLRWKSQRDWGTI